MKKDFEFFVEEGFSIPGMDEKGILVKENDTKMNSTNEIPMAFLNEKSHIEILMKIV